MIPLFIPSVYLEKHIYCVFVTILILLWLHLPYPSKKSVLDFTDLQGKRLRRCPAVLIGRLATNKKFAGKGIGTAVMDLIKNWFRYNNKTGCRFIIVDAYNSDSTIHYYQKNGFKYLVEDERFEAKYMEIGVGRLPLNTRLMYFDLLGMEDIDDTVYIS